MLFPIRVCVPVVVPPTCCTGSRVRILRQRRGPAVSLFLTPVSSALLLLCRCPLTSVSNSKYQWPMGAAAPAVAQWIPLQGICHDFVHGWQWREVVRTRKALRPLSGLRTPPWHFLDVELVVLWQLKIVVVPVFECHDRAPSFSLMCGANCFLLAKVLQFDSSHSYQATMSSSTNVSGSGTSYLYEFTVKPRRRFLAGVSASRGWYKAVNACVSIDIACPGSGIGPTAQMPKLSHFHAPAGGLYSAWMQHRCISTPR